MKQKKSREQENKPSNKREGYVIAKGFTVVCDRELKLEIVFDGIINGENIRNNIRPMPFSCTYNSCITN